MQQIDVNILPSSLTNDELLRLANYYLMMGELPRNWQLELAARFTELMFKLDRYEEA